MANLTQLQIDALRQAMPDNGQAYLNANNDVADAWARYTSDPANPHMTIDEFANTHYTRYGQDEQRLSPDALASGGTLAQQAERMRQNGFSDAQIASAISSMSGGQQTFDGTGLAANPNADLASYFDRNTGQEDWAGLADYAASHGMSDQQLYDALGQFQGGPNLSSVSQLSNKLTWRGDVNPAVATSRDTYSEPRSLAQYAISNGIVNRYTGEVMDPAAFNALAQSYGVSTPDLQSQVNWFTSPYANQDTSSWADATPNTPSGVSAGNISEMGAAVQANPNAISNVWRGTQGEVDSVNQAFTPRPAGSGSSLPANPVQQFQAPQRSVVQQAPQQAAPQYSPITTIGGSQQAPAPMLGAGNAQYQSSLIKGLREADSRPMTNNPGVTLFNPAAQSQSGTIGALRNTSAGAMNPPVLQQTAAQPNAMQNWDYFQPLRAGQSDLSPTLQYYSANPDVMTAFNSNNYGMSPEQFARTHFSLYGSKEGRADPWTALLPAPGAADPTVRGGEGGGN